MVKALPTRWGLRAIEWLIIIVVVAFIVKLVAPTSGLGIWLQHGFNLAGATIEWFFGGIVQLFRSL